jgi:hypothetical protein
VSGFTRVVAALAAYATVLFVLLWGRTLSDVYLIAAGVALLAAFGFGLHSIGAVGRRARIA